jgi:nucleotide-binding universal stress UspA family protein
MILICYDGSEDAKAAIESAGVLFKGDRALILTVWESFTDLLTHTPGGLGFVTSAPTGEDELDKRSRERAENQAQDGAALARDAGLEATPRVRPRSGTVANTILTEAEEDDADAIVLGTRGLGRFGSLMIGSVSHAVIQSADRTVVMVPSPQVVEKRVGKRHAQAEAAAR